MSRFHVGFEIELPLGSYKIPMIALIQRRILPENLFPDRHGLNATKHTSKNVLELILNIENSIV